MTPIDWLRENLKTTFALPPSAIDWLIMVYEIIQVFDDIADGDNVSRKDLNSTIWNVFIGMNQNQFFVLNNSNLMPILANAILKWQASDTAERLGNADEKSFVWRAGYYDLILMAVLITHGPDYAINNSHLVMQLYGEKFEEYIKEFKNA